MKENPPDEGYSSVEDERNETREYLHPEPNLDDRLKIVMENYNSDE